MDIAGTVARVDSPSASRVLVRALPRGFVPIRSASSGPASRLTGNRNQVGPKPWISADPWLGWISQARRTSHVPVRALGSSFAAIRPPISTLWPDGPPRREPNGAGPEARISQDPWPGWISQACCASYTRAGSHSIGFRAHPAAGRHFLRRRAVRYGIKSGRAESPDI